MSLVEWHGMALQAVPFVEIIEVLALWFCISVPMVFLGAYFGYRKPVEAYPVVTSNIPRQVRQDDRHSHFVFLIHVDLCFC